MGIVRITSTTRWRSRRNPALTRCGRSTRMRSSRRAAKQRDSPFGLWARGAYRKPDAGDSHESGRFTVERWTQGCCADDYRPFRPPEISGDVRGNRSSCGRSVAGEPIWGISLRCPDIELQRIFFWRTKKKQPQYIPHEALEDDRYPHARVPGSIKMYFSRRFAEEYGFFT